MFEGIEPAIDGGGGQVGVVLLLDEGIDIAPGHRPRVLGERRKKQTEISTIVLDSME